MKPILLVVALLFFALPGICQQNFTWAFETHQFDDVNNFSENLAIIRKGRIKGYIDTTGRVHLAPKYNIIDAFTEGLASAGHIDWAKMNSTSGFINRSGQFVVEPQFEVTSPFQEGLSCVKKEGKWGFINPSGKYIIPSIYEEANVFSKGLAAVKINGK